MDCLFCKIVAKEIPATVVYEDEDVMVFPDIHPVKPTHLILIPKKHVAEFIAVEEPVMFGKLMQVAQRVIREHGLATNGYRISINGGGAQDVNHLHIHIMGPMVRGAKM